MSTADPGWSFAQAAKVFLSATWNDLGAAGRRREALLKIPGIAQGTVRRQGAVSTYLYTKNEDAKATVLFLHGTPGGAEDWAWFLKNPGAFRIIALDRPGYGPYPQNAPDPERDMGLLGDLLGALAKEGPVIVAGHSMGGGLAARLAVDHPDKVAGLVLIGASLDATLEKIQPIQRLFALPPFGRLLTRSVRHSNAELLLYPDFLRRLEPRLPEIKCPVAVVHAKDDTLVPFSNAAFIQSRFTGAGQVDVSTLETGGHFLNRTAPEAVLQAAQRV